MSVAQQSAAALAHPCFEPDECTNPRYFWRPEAGVTAALTVNIGME